MCPHTHLRAGLPAQGRAYLPQLMFVDPSQYMRNERMFLMWLRTGITLGGIATGGT